MKIILSSILISGLLLSSSGFAAGNDYRILQQQWAEAKYQTAEDDREKAFEALAATAEQMSQANPKNAELLIWQAIILSTYAGEKGGLGALSLVKEAKVLLEQAADIDADALQGSIYTSLGSLYYQVPGWPIAFGDDDKAREYLEKALVINPDGIDANYFYGDFLLEEGEYQLAINVFEKALKAPARTDRPLADQGRKQEIQQALTEARGEL